VFFTSDNYLNCGKAQLLQSWNWLLCCDTKHAVICCIRRWVYRHWQLDVNEEKNVTKYGALWKCMFYNASVLVTVWIQRHNICSLFSIIMVEFRAQTTLFVKYYCHDFKSKMFHKVTKQGTAVCFNVSSS
jgi:hypothetical protein